MFNNKKTFLRCVIVDVVRKSVNSLVIFGIILAVIGCSGDSDPAPEQILDEVAAAAPTVTSTPEPILLNIHFVEQDPIRVSIDNNNSVELVDEFRADGEWTEESLGLLQTLVESVDASKHSDLIWYEQNEFLVLYDPTGNVVSLAISCGEEDNCSAVTEESIQEWRADRVGKIVLAEGWLLLGGTAYHEAEESLVTLCLNPDTGEPEPKTFRLSIYSAFHPATGQELEVDYQDGLPAIVNPDNSDQIISIEEGVSIPEALNLYMNMASSLEDEGVIVWQENTIISLFKDGPLALHSAFILLNETGEVGKAYYLDPANPGRINCNDAIWSPERGYWKEHIIGEQRLEIRGGYQGVNMDVVIEVEAPFGAGDPGTPEFTSIALEQGTPDFGAEDRIVASILFSFYKGWQRMAIEQRRSVSFDEYLARLASEEDMSYTLAVGSEGLQIDPMDRVVFVFTDHRQDYVYETGSYGGFGLERHSDDELVVHMYLPYAHEQTVGSGFGATVSALGNLTAFENAPHSGLILGMIFPEVKQYLFTDHSDPDFPQDPVLRILE